MDGKKYIIVSDPNIGLSQIKADCLKGDLCIPFVKGESLVSILNKICANQKDGKDGKKGDKGEPGTPGPEGPPEVC